jgi:hypothetical protein
MYFALQVLVEPTPLLTRPRPITTIPYSDYSFKLFLSSFWAILYFMVILHMLGGYAIINHACLYTRVCAGFLQKEEEGDRIGGQENLS